MIQCSSFCFFLGKARNSEYPSSEKVSKALELLETLDKWIDETPPIDQPQRFGNKAFKLWYKKLQEVIGVKRSSKHKFTHF